MIYLSHIVVFLGIYWILAAGLDLALGYAGLFNIGHAAFYGIGAYTSALLTVHVASFPFLLALLLGGIFAGCAAFLLGLTVFKLRGDYLALATLGFGVIVEGILKNWTELTGGPRGLAGIPQAEVFALPIATPMAYACMVLIFAGLIVLVLRQITNSHFGRIVKSIRSDEVAAKALGTNVREFKLTVLVLSAFFAGVSGALYAHYLGSVDPGRFTLTESFLIISMVIIGGTASLKGALVGTVIIVLIPEALRLLELTSARMAAIREILFALSLLIILIYRPQGIVGKRALRRR